MLNFFILSAHSRRLSDGEFNLLVTENSFANSFWQGECLTCSWQKGSSSVLMDCNKQEVVKARFYLANKLKMFYLFKVTKLPMGVLRWNIKWITEVACGLRETCIKQLFKLGNLAQTLSKLAVILMFSLCGFHNIYLGIPSEINYFLNSTLSIWANVPLHVTVYERGLRVVWLTMWSVEPYTATSITYCLSK